MTKVCNVCNEDKPLDQFYKHKSCKDGRYPNCKACRSLAMKARRQTSEFKKSEARKKERALELAVDAPTKTCGECGEAKEKVGNFYVKTDSADGFESVCKVCRLNYFGTRRNDPLVREYNKEWQKQHNKKPEVRNRKKLLQRIRIRRPDVKLDMARRQREWVKANPEKNAINTRRYRHRKLALEGYHTYEELEDILVEQLGKCVYCGTSLLHGYSVDHIIPITMEGSTDFAYNIQLLCKSCNSSKNNKTHEEYIIYLDERSQYV